MKTSVILSEALQASEDAMDMSCVDVAGESYAGVAHGSSEIQIRHCSSSLAHRGNA
jgi:hypothetical protein